MAVIAVLLAGPGRQSDRQITRLGDFSTYSLTEVQQAYQDTPDNNNLLLLLKVLAWRAEVQDDAEAISLIPQYRQILLDRARAEEVDLQTLDEEDIMLALLSILNDWR